MSPGTEDRGKTDDRSDVRQKYARFTQSPNRFEPGQADGRQPFMPQDYLTMPAFDLIPSVSPMRGGKRPLSVERVSTPFIQRLYNIPCFYFL